MKTRWYKKKLTFLVIGNAQQSIVQFRILKPILFFVPLMVLTISTALVLLYQIHKTSVEESQLTIASLNAQIADSQQLYESTVQAKDRTIEILQSDIISLSHQAEQIKTKVDELMKLEFELRDVTEPIANTDDVVTIASLHDEQINILKKESSDGVGGIHIPVSDEDIKRLAAMTESDFYVLDAGIDLLIERLEFAKGQILEYQEYLRVTPSIYPTVSQRVTSNFGYRVDPFTRRPSFHSGIDFGGDRHDPVYATADGVVQTSSKDRHFGNYIIIQHDNGIRTHYYHLQKSDVTKGQEVVKGEQIGTLGSTGRSTGPHLHYEVEKDGVKVDPKPYLIDTRKDEP